MELNLVFEGITALAATGALIFAAVAANASFYGRRALLEVHVTRVKHEEKLLKVELRVTNRRPISALVPKAVISAGLLENNVKRVYGQWPSIEGGRISKKLWTGAHELSLPNKIGPDEAGTIKFFVELTKAKKALYLKIELLVDYPINWRPKDRLSCYQEFEFNQILYEVDEPDYEL